MSLFGSSPPTPTMDPSSSSRGLFDDKPEPASPANASPSALFADPDHDHHASPWDALPTPRRQRSRAELVRTLLRARDLPPGYVEIFDIAVRDDPAAAAPEDASGQPRAVVGPAAIAKVFAAARLDPVRQSEIMRVVSPDPDGDGGNVALGKEEFCVLLALVGLAQEGEAVSLDGVDERRRNLPIPKLVGLTVGPVLPPVAELAAKPPQTPSVASPPPLPRGRVLSKPSAPPVMDYPDPESDPWSRPETPSSNKPNGLDAHSPPHSGNGYGGASSSGAGTPYEESSPESPADATRHASPPYAAAANMPNSGSPLRQPSVNTAAAAAAPSNSPWGFLDAHNPAGGFGDQTPSPFGPPSSNTPDHHARGGSSSVPHAAARRPGGRPVVEDNVVVTLMPEKEGVFMFQHHNYEVASSRRNTKVIRRYSDFVWLLDCLHKRYPFRVLPLLPPKRVAVNGNHLSNDGAFIEKRRRGLARFLNALVRHPILCQEQLVVMFLTVPTELAVWRKQATISVQEEFAGRAILPGLEESLPNTLEDLFERTRAGIKRSAELYITVCNVMDRLVKRSEGVAADHARIAVALASLVEVTADAYASDTSDVPRLNDGLACMGRHLRSYQDLLEDESRAWDAGVLEDLKRQRDALVAVRDTFDRRDRLDRDNIPSLERRIGANETKLAALRAKPEGTVRPGDVERVVESIIRDKESIVAQHNRSVFVRECIRDELLYFHASQYHVTRWNQDWAQERVKYAEMHAVNWRRLLDELERMPRGDE